jgi:DNA-binding LacI/PurR family transcriptional regulator
MSPCVCPVIGLLAWSTLEPWAARQWEGVDEAARVDGYVVWTTALGWLLPKREIAEFLERFRSKPVVSLEMAFPGLPSVLMDDRGGMRSAVDHLIEEHGRRRVAFVRRPAAHEGCESRYLGYRDSLAAHGIPWDPALASAPSDDIDGAGAMRAILEASGAGSTPWPAPTTFSRSPSSRSAACACPRTCRSWASTT